MVSSTTVLAGAFACAIASLASLALRASESLVQRPLSEDGYYSLSIARNIAHGHGMTIDGTMHTNGFQPLFTFLCVPLFLFTSDRVLPLRGVLAVHVLFYAASALLLGRIARDALGGLDPGRRKVAFWTTAVVFVSGTVSFIEQFNGLETGCVVFLYVLIWRYYQTHPLTRPGRVLMLGVLLGIITLARVDAAFFVVIVCFGELFANDSAEVRRARWARFFTLAGTAFVVSSPWWLYNLFGFGSLMPRSGAATQAWVLSGDRFVAASLAWLQVCVPWVYAGMHLPVVVPLVQLSVVVALVVLWRPVAARFAPADAALVGRTERMGAMIVATGVLFFFWYASSSSTTAFYRRYFILVVPVATVIASRTVIGVTLGRPGRWATLAALGVAPVVLAVVLAHLQVGFPGNILYKEQLALVRARVPDTDLVAAGQSGTLGYFRDRVVNLDGKVNPVALRRRRDIPQYLVERDIHWFCDWHEYATANLGSDPARQGWDLVATEGRAELYHRR